MSINDTSAWLAREEAAAREEARRASAEASRSQAKALAEAIKDIEQVRAVTVIGPDGRMANETLVDDIGPDPSKWPAIVSLSKYRTGRPK